MLPSIGTFVTTLKIWENVGPLQKEMGNPVTQDMENINILRDFFASVFSHRCSTHTAQVPGRDWGNEEPPTVGDQSPDHLETWRCSRPLLGWKEL